MQRAARRTVDRLEQEINNLSRLIHELRPEPLEALGLRRALESLAESTAEQSGIAIETRIEIAARLSADAERAVYRLCQEGLNNVVKHSEASRATLAATQTNGELTLRVADDGAGFDASQASSGVGLRSMRERVELLGGTFRIASRPGGGTEIKASLPIGG